MASPRKCPSMRTSHSKYLKEAKAAQNKEYNRESTHFQLLPHCSQYPKHGTSLDGQQQTTDKGNVVQSHSGIWFSQKEEWNYVIFWKMEGPGNHSKRNKLDTENNPHIFSHLWELKFFVKYICLSISTSMHTYIIHTWVTHTYIYIKSDRQQRKEISNW